MLERKELNLIDRYAGIVKEVFQLDMCLIGGWAVKHYSNPPATLDFDFLCDERLFNLVQDRFEFSRLYPILKFDYGLDVKITEETNLVALGFPVLWLKKNNIRVDLFGADTAFRKSALANAEVIPNTDIKVVSLIDMLTFKTVSNRVKDKKHFNILRKQYRLTKSQLAEIADNANNEMMERG